MEFWHCHKPDENGSGSGSIKDRFDSFKPRGRDLFVGSFYFVLNSNEFGSSFINSSVVTDDIDMEMDDDKKKLEKTQSQVTKQTGMRCGGCRTVLGEHDQMSGNERLLKWNLKLVRQIQQNQNHKLEKQVFEPYLYVYYNLIDSISSSAVRFHLIRNKDTKPQSQTGSNPQTESPTDFNQDRLFIWCFNFGLTVTETGGLLMHDTLKILYHDKYDKINELLSKQELNYEVMDVPGFVFCDLKKALNSFHSDLPSGESGTFREWKVSYLPGSIG
ncbi:unnamed protein product [Ambrosiozyma monospora]|uniref:Unnamed protein product n=1 Tax=Ambrosiozyma monospora TaxID=43982 RepID=A0A9W6Z0L0_AMBMO|nr:unnamed protein product [Ambrosiozyma monospora]